MWFTYLLTNGGVGTTVLMLAISIFAGLLLGKIKVKGITLGITWVLFVGIGLSAIGITCNHEMLHVQVLSKRVECHVTVRLSVEPRRSAALHTVVESVLPTDGTTTCQSTGRVS